MPGLSLRYVPRGPRPLRAGALATWLVTAVLVAACGSSGAVASTGAQSSTGGPVVSTGAAAAPPGTPATASGQAGGVPAPPPWPVPADQIALIRKAGLTHPGVVPPDVAPGITLAGLPQGFPVPTVSLRTNDDIAYLDTLTDQGDQREQPLVARKLLVFEVKASQSQQGGTVDVILWRFDSRASAQDYLARSGVFVTGTPQAAPSVAAGAQLVFGPDPNQSDGSTLGQVAWVHGPWAIVVLEATAPGIIDQNGLIRLAATVEQEAGGLPAP